MKKIGHAEKAERAKKRNAVIIGVFLVVLMLSSTVGFVTFYGGGIPAGNFDSGNNDNGLGDGATEGIGANYNGQYWIVSLEGQEFYFSMYEGLIRKVPVEIQKSLHDFVGNTIYVDSESHAAMTELSNNMGRYGRIQQACYEGCEQDLPEIGCTQTEQNLIVVRNAEENRVYQEENCIFIENIEEDLSAVDAFLYSILGI